MLLPKHAVASAHLHTHYTNPPPRPVQILFERGFTPLLDIQYNSIPERFDQGTGRIHLNREKVYVIQVSWPRPSLRPESDTRH